MGPTSLDVMTSHCVQLQLAMEPTLASEEEL
jgi:hypothetical protein